MIRKLIWRIFIYQIFLLSKECENIFVIAMVVLNTEYDNLSQTHYLYENYK